MCIYVDALVCVCVCVCVTGSIPNMLITTDSAVWAVWAVRVGCLGVG